MRGIHVYITILGVLFGFALGWGVFTRSAESGVDSLRDLATELEGQLAESERALGEAREAHRELVATNTELREALDRTAGYNFELAERNRRITGALNEAERDLELAVRETSELTELLDRIISIVDDLFSGSGVDDS